MKEQFNKLGKSTVESIDKMTSIGVGMTVSAAEEIKNALNIAKNEILKAINKISDSKDKYVAGAKEKISDFEEKGKETRQDVMQKVKSTLTKDKVKGDSTRKVKNDNSEFALEDDSFLDIENNFGYNTSNLDDIEGNFDEEISAEIIEYDDESISKV